MMARLLIYLYCVCFFCTLSAIGGNKTNKQTEEYAILNEERQSFTAPFYSPFLLYGFYAPGSSPGVDSSYESIGAVYFGKVSPGSLFPLIEVQQNFLNNGTWAPSGGIGSRYMNSRGNRIYGINFFYDGLGLNYFRFHQLGAGIELLSPFFDFRLNSYFPLNSHFTGDPTVYDNYIGDYFVIATFEEYAYRGFDAECGMRFPLMDNIYFYTGIGPYFLASKIAKSWGIQWRARCNLWSTVFAEVQITNDTIFNDRYRGYIGVEIPFDRFAWSLNRGFNWISQPVHRQNIISRGCCCEYQTNY